MNERERERGGGGEGVVMLLEICLAHDVNGHCLTMFSPLLQRICMHECGVRAVAGVTQFSLRSRLAVTHTHTHTHTHTLSLSLSLSLSPPPPPPNLPRLTCLLTYRQTRPLSLTVGQCADLRSDGSADVFNIQDVCRVSLKEEHIIFLYPVAAAE